MASFPGGSAWAMAKDIAEGYVLCTERTFQRFAAGELDQLAFEIDRMQRDVRGNQPALDDLPALQVRNRKLQRLSGAIAMLRAYQQRARRGRTATPPSGGGPGRPSG
ncbi:MAG TPA: hypothetical protein VLA75_02085 [Thermoanaerobaculia bacterium]|nr:hypothetical protein [Thermoanaerobaculia bacterium]